MSRSGYSEDCGSDWDLIMYRGAVASAIRGKRGQKFLRELIDALDAMPTKRLITSKLEHNGEVCALGSVGKRLGLSMPNLDYDDDTGDTIASMFGIAPALAREIMWENDEASWCGMTPENRWAHMRAWAVKNIYVAPTATP